MNFRMIFWYAMVISNLLLLTHGNNILDDLETYEWDPEELYISKRQAYPSGPNTQTSVVAGSSDAEQSASESEASSFYDVAGSSAPNTYLPGIGYPVEGEQSYYAQGGSSSSNKDSSSASHSDYIQAASSGSPGAVYPPSDAFNVYGGDGSPPYLPVAPISSGGLYEISGRTFKSNILPSPKAAEATRVQYSVSESAGFSAGNVAKRSFEVNSVKIPGKIDASLQSVRELPGTNVAPVDVNSYRLSGRGPIYRPVSYNPNQARTVYEYPLPPKTIGKTGPVVLHAASSPNREVSISQLSSVPQLGIPGVSSPGASYVPQIPSGYSVSQGSSAPGVSLSQVSSSGYGINIPQSPSASSGLGISQIPSGYSVSQTPSSPGVSLPQVGPSVYGLNIPHAPSGTFGIPQIPSGYTGIPPGISGVSPPVIPGSSGKISCSYEPRCRYV